MSLLTKDVTIVWKDDAPTAVSDSNRTETLDWTDLNIRAHTSAKAKFAILLLAISNWTTSAATPSNLGVRKNGTSPSNYPKNQVDKTSPLGVTYRQVVILALDSGQVLEYRIYVSTDYQVDTKINVLGYTE